MKKENYTHKNIECELLFSVIIFKIKEISKMYFKTKSKYFRKFKTSKIFHF